MIVENCLCCFSLEYGCYTWAIISFLTKICVASTTYKIGSFFNEDKVFVRLVMGCVFGWSLGTVLVIGVALKGIVEKRHMLIFPYIVVLVIQVIIVEILVIFSISTTGLSYKLIIMIVSIAVDTYAMICFLSLYRNIKQKNKHKRKMETTNLTNGV